MVHSFSGSILAGSLWCSECCVLYLHVCSRLRPATIHVDSQTSSVLRKVFLTPPTNLQPLTIIFFLLCPICWCQHVNWFHAEIPRFLCGNERKLLHQQRCDCWCKGMQVKMEPTSSKTPRDTMNHTWIYMLVFSWAKTTKMIFLAAPKNNFLLLNFSISWAPWRRKQPGVKHALCFSSYWNKTYI